MRALRLPPDLEARLDALLKKTGRTKISFVREAIVEFIDDLEDFHLAQARCARIERGESKTLTLNEVEAQVGALPCSSFVA